MKAGTHHPRNGCNLRLRQLTVNETSMDLGLIAAVVMLLVWAVVTVATEAPGYVHLLLTIGVFVLIWRITVRGSPGTRSTLKK